MIDQRAAISPKATLGHNVSVAPFAAAPAPVVSKPSPSVQASPRAEAVKPGPQASDHADASSKKTPSGKSGN